MFIVCLCIVSGRVDFTSGVTTHPRFGLHLRGCFFFLRCGIHLRRRTSSTVWDSPPGGGWKFLTNCCSPPGAVVFLFRMVFTSGCVFVAPGMYYLAAVGHALPLVVVLGFEHHLRRCFVFVLMPLFCFLGAAQIGVEGLPKSHQRICLIQLASPHCVE